MAVSTANILENPRFDLLHPSTATRLSRPARVTALTATLLQCWLVDALDTADWTHNRGDPGDASKKVVGHLKHDEASLSAPGSVFYPYGCLLQHRVVTQGPHTAPCPQTHHCRPPLPPDQDHAGPQ